MLIFLTKKKDAMKVRTIPLRGGYLLIVFLNSCVLNSIPNNNGMGQAYVYECEGGYEFVASIEDGGVWLFLPDQAIKLPHVSSGSGTKYREGDKLFWSKGDEAFLEIAGGKYQGCINNRAKAIWEQAKLNGWDYRAGGNEPDWHILISKEKGIVFVSDYGQTVNKFAVPEPLIDKINATAKYHVQENGHNLDITIKGTKCLDTMSDELFETSVTVTLDNERFNGCGKALH